MNLHLIQLEPIISVIAGILILVQPRILNYVIAIYLIISGILRLSPYIST
jgi:uncharacterized membrane protein HdeD (DUF308 family)